MHCSGFCTGNAAGLCDEYISTAHIQIYLPVKSDGAHSAVLTVFLQQLFTHFFVSSTQNITQKRLIRVFHEFLAQRVDVSASHTPCHHRDDRRMYRCIESRNMQDFTCLFQTHCSVKRTEYRNPRGIYTIDGYPFLYQLWC